MLLAELDHCDFIAFFVVTNFIHECLDQRQAAVAVLREVGRIGRVRERAPVKSFTVILDDVGRLLPRHVGPYVNSAAFKGRLALTLLEQGVIGRGVSIKQARIQFEIPMVDGVVHGLFQRNTDPHPRRHLAEPQASQVILHQANDGYDVQGIIVDREVRCQAIEALQCFLIPPFGRRQCKLPFDHLGQIMGQPSFGKVTCRTFFNASAASSSLPTAVMTITGKAG